MRTIITAMFVLLSVFASSQNNPIFGGGNADGWNRTNFSQAENNIYPGGAGDGFAQVAFAQASNNIFNGGSGDGWNRSDFSQALTNIFNGGVADGWSRADFAQGVNNIFNGGNADGWSRTDFAQSVNNIFFGGNGDGWNSMNFAQAGNNIFPGGIGDGWASTYRPMAPLPVQFINFTAVRYAKLSSLLQWQTSSEQNSSHFDIERSNDAVNFTRIGRVQAAGNSNLMKSYSFVDANAMNGMNYYRIRQVDLNGRSVLTPARLVRFDEQVIAALAVYPNPTNGVAYLDLRALPAQGQAAITITAANGEVKDQMRMTLNAPQILTIDLTKFSAGTYFVQFVSGTTKTTTRVVKL